jgi:hypothetical protein
MTNNASRTILIGMTIVLYTAAVALAAMYFSRRFGNAPAAAQREEDAGEAPPHAAGEVAAVRGDSIARVTSHAVDGKLFLRVTVETLDGKPLHDLAVPPDELGGANCVLETGWIDDNRIYILGHVNPSLGRLLEVRFSDGKATGRDVTDFLWNPKGAHLLYVRDPPHLNTPEEVMPEMFLDDRKIADLPDRGPRRLFWNEEGDRFGVLVEAETGTQLCFVPVDAAGKVEWQKVETGKTGTEKTLTPSSPGGSGAKNARRHRSMTRSGG